MLGIPVTFSKDLRYRKKFLTASLLVPEGRGRGIKGERRDRSRNVNKGLMGTDNGMRIDCGS